MSVTESQVGGGICLCVLGMHRSGTSALMRLLGLLGVQIGSDFCPAAPDNPTGFWELRPIVRTHDELFETLKSAFDDFWPLKEDWESRDDIRDSRTRLIEIVRTHLMTGPLWGFKDPRTCRTAPLWKSIFAELGTAARYIVLVRHPREIAKSLAAQNGMPVNHALLLTMEHLRTAELSTRGERRVFMTYEQLLADWRGTARRLAGELGVTWPVTIDQAAPEVDKFLDPNRRHQRADKREADPLADPRLLDLAERQHDIFVKAAHGKPISTKALDRVNARLVADLVRHAGWRDARSPRGEVMRLEAWAAERTVAIEYLSGELNYLKKKLADMSPTPSPETTPQPSPEIPSA